MICRTCTKDKNEAEFSFRDKARGLRHRQCKQCHKNDALVCYNKHIARYKSTAAVRRKQHKHQLHTLLYQYLLDHPCVDCGESDPVVLDSDHVGQKRDGITQLIKRGASWETVKDELSQCETRCSNCHRRKTAQRNGKWFKLVSEIACTSRPLGTPQ